MHALPDGSKQDVGPPRRRRRINADGELQLYIDVSYYLIKMF